MRFNETMRLIRRHPAWALMEASGRLRTFIAPRNGTRLGRVGPIKFEYDFGLSPMVRSMYAGAFETEIVQLIRKLLQPGQVFVDVGANIGYLSSVAAGCVGTSGTVVSFEPAPPYFARLSALREANPEYRWHVFPIGLGADNSQAEIALSSRNIGWNTLAPNQIPDDLIAEKHVIQVRRLDDCVAELGIDRVKVLKIDVEGYEGNVLRGCEHLLRSGCVENLIVEVIPAGYPALGLDFLSSMQAVLDCGYEAHDTRAPYRIVNLNEVRDGSNVWFRRRGS